MLHTLQGVAAATVEHVMVLKRSLQIDEQGSCIDYTHTCMHIYIHISKNENYKNKCEICKIVYKHQRKLQKKTTKKMC